MSRLAVLLDGKPVYLYTFVHGCYDSKRRFICAHRDLMTPEQVRERFKAAVKELPEEIDYDYMVEPQMPDLFERALTLAGFKVVDDELHEGLQVFSSYPPATNRSSLEFALTQERKR